jgi:hypothetical protein
MDTLFSQIDQLIDECGLEVNNKVTIPEFVYELDIQDDQLTHTPSTDDYFALEAMVCDNSPNIQQIVDITHDSHTVESIDDNNNIYISVHMMKKIILFHRSYYMMSDVLNVTSVTMKMAMITYIVEQ